MSTNPIIDHRYRLGPRLGGGGMADVFEARDLRLRRPVALKRCRTTRRRQRLIEEAEVIAGLSHPGLLRLYDIGFEGQRPFLVLQLASGGTLRDRLEVGPMQADRVAEIGAAVASVLAYVHSQGIVHRDVKPENLLFDAEGECYLADFGIARLDDRPVSDFLGTAGYLAPEQVGRGEIGPAVDVYALGLVLLECMTGQVEYPGDGPAAAMARLAHPPKVPGTWGRDWRAVLTAMTATEPRERSDAAACSAMLGALAAGDRVPLPLSARRKERSWVARFASKACAALI
ncbi:serine/threonine-protein kinase [Actinophytocola algeriensis]|uniref:non-specific serine/threonine protein kinase n=1 Tax=Actinophytocola algeriensis TaxID=1768010 RepID=A0A7W7QA59_9PSEU|nr:serine/threonine-protein kinase [Actinophytocola algeriensis]MBB4909698.1 serine/threonine protein kinase [Actinophytocola algeriensis]MBE1475688.1 serine/threonine protein kinase [Actinophytocola algeriensis]